MFCSNRSFPVILEFFLPTSWGNETRLFNKIYNLDSRVINAFNTFQYVPYPQPPMEAHYYFGYPAAPRGSSVSNGYADELRYQTQVWDSLRAGAHSYVPPPPPASFLYTQPHSYGPGYTLPPTGRPVSLWLCLEIFSIHWTNLFCLQRLSSCTPARPLQQHQSSIRSRTRSLDRRITEPLEPTFIKPLPIPPKSENKKSAFLQNNLHEFIRPLSLGESPARRRSSKEVQTEPCYEEKAVGSDQKMPRIDESEDDDDYKEEREDRLADLYIPLRRNSRWWRGVDFFFFFFLRRLEKVLSSRDSFIVTVGDSLLI